jgi:3-oxoacyl-[acyl-carrier protein] reductase
MTAQRVAVVTGGAGAIGGAIAHRLAQGGAAVVIADADDEKARARRDELVNGGARALALHLDVTKRDAWVQTVQAVLAELGRLDVLVNNAGITRDAMLKRMTDDQWDEVIDVHLRGTFLGCQAVLAPMSERGGGRIVNISSTVYLGNVGQANYSAAKGGIVSLTRTVALEGARYGITANAVAPGGVDTPMLRAIPEHMLEKLLERIPLGRLADVSEIAGVVNFLASDDASYVTGQVVHVCGGLTL